MNVKTKPFKANWTESNEYPAVGCKDLNQLAWEFLRRNSEYAKHFVQMLPFLETKEFETGFKKTSESVLDGVECSPEAIPGETVKEFFVRMKSGDIKRPRIEKPRITFATRWSIKHPIHPSTEYEVGKIRFEIQEVKIINNEKFSSKNFTLFVHAHEAAVRFRLDMPLKKQLKEAEVELIKAVKTYIANRQTLSEETQMMFANNENKKVFLKALSKAHYWLRCYDADKGTKLVDVDAKNQRKQKSGASEQLKKFNDDIQKRGSRAFIVDGAQDSFLATARDFIDGKKFQMLPFQSEFDIAT